MFSHYTVTDRLPSADGEHTRPQRALGLACAASGIAAIPIAVVTLVFTSGDRPAVSSDSWSYPFDASAQWVVSGVLAVTHLLTLAGFLGVLVARPHGRSRAATAALWAAVAGYAGLAVCELLSGSIGTSSSDSPEADAVSNAFAVASLVTAAGSIVAGVVIVRRWGLRDLRWSMVLWSGVAMIVLVTPANISGSPVARMIALSVWSLTFVPLGRALIVGQTEPAARALADRRG
jgi:hypothetical protein